MNYKGHGKLSLFKKLEKFELHTLERDIMQLYRIISEKKKANQILLLATLAKQGHKDIQ